MLNWVNYAEKATVTQPFVHRWGSWSQVHQGLESKHLWFNILKRVLMSEWEVKRLASYWRTYYKFPARNRASRRLFITCLNLTWFQVVSGWWGNWFWRYCWLELWGRWVMLYQIGPSSNRRLLNTHSEWGFLDCRKKDPFLFVSQTKVAPFFRS